MAVAGRLDAHFTALWEGGHIKFWSERTIRRLLTGAGFQDVKIARVGRIPPVAKPMIVAGVRSNEED